MTTASAVLAGCADDLVRETNGRIGMVQDAWWWNTAAMPTVHTHRERGLMRPSLKPCVWIGAENCHRDQGAVLWSESESNVAIRAEGRMGLDNHPSGVHVRHGRAGAAAADRGGVTPFNLLPVSNTNSSDSAGASDHGAGTPYDLAAWWVRYICPKDGIVVDPCGGTMTMGLAAVRQGRRFLGCEKMESHYQKGVVRMASCNLDTESPIVSRDADFGPLFGVK